MNEIAIAVMVLFGGLTCFLVGMEMLQKATEKLASTSLKKLFSKTASNPLVGVGISTLATMIMQSSGATSVMVVGFVNSGAMSLTQAVSYIMGANIGTTITAQIAALGNFPISEIFICVSFIGMIMLMFFKKKEKIALSGELVIGLGLLFLGLLIMEDNFNALFELVPAMSDFLVNLTNPVLLLLIGIVFTTAIQSSSVITSILISMALAGVVVGGSGNGVLYVILGSNIGSTTTALISSIGSTRNGKRTAIIHLLFNVIGSVIFFIILLCFPQFNEVTFVKLFPSSPATQIAMFHTFFNVVCTIIFLPFIKWFVKLSELIIPDKNEKEKIELDIRFLKNPSLALSEADRYFASLSNKALLTLQTALDSFVKNDEEASKTVILLNKEIEADSKTLNKYLADILNSGTDNASNAKISMKMLDIADIDRLAEIADNITSYTSHRVNENLTFSQGALNKAEKIYSLIEKQYSDLFKMLENDNYQIYESIKQREDEIDNERSSAIKEHLVRLNNGECKGESSRIYINLIGNLERAADHLFFIANRESGSSYVPQLDKD